MLVEAAHNVGDNIAQSHASQPLSLCLPACLPAPLARPPHLRPPGASQLRHSSPASSAARKATRPGGERASEIEGPSGGERQACLVGLRIPTTLSAFAGADLGAPLGRGHGAAQVGFAPGEPVIINYVGVEGGASLWARAGRQAAAAAAATTGTGA